MRFLRATRLPLYRQAEIFARGGVSLETSTLSGWVGATAAALQPLVDALAVDVLASDTLHVDDTPVPVLAPGTGKTKTGRLWTYVRDERPFAGARPPAALFFYSPDRKGEHPQAHLTDFRGVIHADGYAGFNELFTGGRIVEAACWAPWPAWTNQAGSTSRQRVPSVRKPRRGSAYRLLQTRSSQQVSGNPKPHWRGSVSARSISPRRCAAA